MTDKEQDKILATGLDMSPGDPLARKAAAAIRLLIKRIAVVAAQRDAAKEHIAEEMLAKGYAYDVTRDAALKEPR